MPLTNDEDIAELLANARTIAMVGASQNPARPSWIVTKYLLERGYRVTAVEADTGGVEILRALAHPKPGGVDRRHARGVRGAGALAIPRSRRAARTPASARPASAPRAATSSR
mgnify:CR=1 FL=1